MLVSQYANFEAYKLVMSISNINLEALLPI